MEFYNAHVNARRQFLYEKELKELIEFVETFEHPIILEICRGLHGKTFGKPGYGSVSFVQSELEKAKIIFNAIKEYIK